MPQADGQWPPAIKEKSDPMPTFAKAVIYTQHGAPEVLQLVDREVPTPAAGQVLVRIVVSGINPTDWKNRDRKSVV